MLIKNLVIFSLLFVFSGCKNATYEPKTISAKKFERNFKSGNYKITFDNKSLVIAINGGVFIVKDGNWKKIYECNKNWCPEICVYIDKIYLFTENSCFVCVDFEGKEIFKKQLETFGAGEIKISNEKIYFLLANCGVCIYSLDGQLLQFITDFVKYDHKFNARLFVKHNMVFMLEKTTGKLLHSIGVGLNKSDPQKREFGNETIIFFDNDINFLTLSQFLSKFSGCMLKEAEISNCDMTNEDCFDVKFESKDNEKYSVRIKCLDGKVVAFQPNVNWFTCYRCDEKAICNLDKSIKIIDIFYQNGVFGILDSYYNFYIVEQACLMEKASIDN
jgi:hypothetical protein